MGKWGLETFEDDTALDWLWHLEQADDPPRLVRDLIASPTQGSSGVWTHDRCMQVLAILELVDAVHDAPSDDLPEETASFLHGAEGLQRQLRSFPLPRLLD